MIWKYDMKPSEIQTSETLRFILENILSNKSRILEIGCGSGKLAKQLDSLGHEIVAVDSSEKLIKNARRIGVDARIANFPDFEEQPFDVILFTRSLHHIRPLLPALDKTHHLVKPSGLVLVEDFAYNDTNEFTAAWFYTLLKLLESCNALTVGKDSFGRRLLQGNGDISLWQDHVHKINTAQEILQAISERFKILKAKSAPYLYRYISAMVPDDAAGGRIISSVFELEQKTGIEIEQFLIGRRFIAQR